MNYSKLFIDNCPIIYFNKKEPYMPVDFSDILDVAEIKPTNLHKVNIVYLYEQDKTYNKIGKEILCKTNGEIEIDGEIYIDLIYIILYLWSSDKEHPFDKSIIIIRLNKNYEIHKICCLNKNEYIWYDKDEIIFENNKPVLFSSLKTHNILNKDITFKKDIKWVPSNLIIFEEKNKDSFNNIHIIDSNNNKVDKDVSYYLYDKNIGNENFNQQMPSSVQFDIVKKEAFYNYNGDLFNLFNDYKTGISFGFILKIFLFLFILFMIYSDIKKYHFNLFNISYIIITISLIIISSI